MSGSNSAERKRYEPLVLVETADLSEEDWLDYRRRGIGGSDVSAIFGTSPFRTARDLYYDKLNIASVEDDEGNWVAMEMGHLLEPLVAKIFERKTGYRVYQIKKMFQHPQYPWMLADVDYFVELPDGTTAILEIKTTNYNARDNWWMNGKETVPVYYESQGRHYMAVTDLDRCFFCCLYGNNEEEVIIREVKRDFEYEAEMVFLEQYFWENHVQRHVPPPYTESGALIIESARKHFGPADKNAPAVALDLDMTAKLIEAMGDHCNYEVSWMDSGGAEGLPAIARENPLTEELRQELLAIDGVESITSHEVTSATVKFPQESVALKFPVFDREQMEQWLPEENLEQGSADYEELAANNGVVVTDSEDHLLSMFYGYTPAVGDVLTFESMDGKSIEVTVMGIAKPSVTSGTGAWGLFTLTEELADQLYPDIENREAVWNVHTSEDSDALRASIFSLLENPVLTVFSRADHAASLESQLKMMTRGVYLLLAFLFVFSMVNLVNTLMTNLLARQQELGILQSVGMTGKQVSRMLIAECLWYAGVTVFLSVGIGGILGWIFDYVISNFNIFGELSYQFPLMETVVFVLALLVVTGIFSVVAVRYSKRLSLVERIKTMD